MNPLQDQGIVEPELLLDQLREALAGARTVADAKTALERLGASAAGRTEFQVRLLHLQLMEKAGLGSATSDGWAALFAEQSDHLLVARYHVISLRRARDVSGARAVIDATCREVGDEAADRVALQRRAELLDDIYQHDESFAIFRDLVSRYPADRRIRIDFAKRLGKIGRYKDVVDQLEEVAPALQEKSRAKQLYDDARVQVECLERLVESGRDLHGVDCRLVALELVLKRFETRLIASGSNHNLIAMITGGLGAGGAERQLTRLTRLMVEREQGPREEAINQFEVIVRSHATDSARNDFFLPELQAEEIPVHQIDQMTPHRADRQVVLSDDLTILYSMLPAPVHYGVTRLAPFLRERQFNVASIWQDGACLFAALAALFAGVAKIQLLFRGLPPNIRRDRNRDEYPILFKGLARVPGVQFVTNSQVVAREYADWLGIPVSDIEVLYNAVPACHTEPEPIDRQKWDAFAAETPHATATVGGVFRLEPDKQPLRWIRMASMLHAMRPQTRFVIVGEGRLRNHVEALAEKLGIADRLLLVGHSRCVGFWYDQMDVKVLLSRFEGLPNVLIEAQSLGTPVVSTPAGGAGECFLEGQTGHILGCAQDPSIEEACDRVGALLDMFSVDEEMGNRAKDFVADKFSEWRAVEVFSELLSRSPRQPARHRTLEDAQ